MTDPIADLLTRIRNGITAEHDVVEMPASSFKAEIARILQEQGYIEAYEVAPARVGQTLRVRLKYTEDRRSVISGIDRLSRPGHRRYVGSGDVPKVLGGMGTSIISTSRGVMSGHDARRAGVGGELVARVW
ncbi:MAG TPA: 30S ribosomal protein S8 [Thermoleophilaceae bacterium]|nr:30S ribosomal protein S8 [Thermoleophilaceae bacterium]